MTGSYVTPVRRITTEEDLKRWVESDTFREIEGFVQQLQNSILGLTNDAEVACGAKTGLVMKLLEEIDACVDRHPVVYEKDVSRFGKVEFRDFYDEVSSWVGDALEPLLEGFGDHVAEVKEYLVESWGSRKRIDYGSGHELNFICFLYCLYRLGIVNESDFPCLVLKVFNKYIATMRRLQVVYWLEPAGSHGVWGLDDYHFLPFLFGASQLATHPFMRPSLVHNEELVADMYGQYMYFECIHFINSIKTTPKNQDQKLSIRWHSPMLDDILSAKSWMKIKQGMIKMYEAEVLSKLPIMQHFLFGTIISCPEGISEYHEHGDDEDGCGHEVHSTWGDCCGIKIPSAIAASEMNKRINGTTFKPVPFD